jgi:hypothetical protein
MANPTHDFAAGQNARAANNEPPITGAPRWAKVFGPVALAVIVAFIVLKFTVFGGM